VLTFVYHNAPVKLSLNRLNQYLLVCNKDHSVPGLVNAGTRSVSAYKCVSGRASVGGSDVL